MEIDKLTEQILEITNNSDYGWIDLDSADADRIRVALTQAMNYIPCCTELKDKKALTFEGWLKDNDKQYIYDDFIEGSFTYSMGSWYREYLKDVK